MAGAGDCWRQGPIGERGKASGSGSEQLRQGAGDGKVGPQRGWRGVDEALTSLTLEDSRADTCSRATTFFFSSTITSLVNPRQVAAV